MFTLLKLTLKQQKTSRPSRFFNIFFNYLGKCLRINNIEKNKMQNDPIFV